VRSTGPRSRGQAGVRPSACAEPARSRRGPSDERFNPRAQALLPSATLDRWEIARAIQSGARRAVKQGDRLHITLRTERNRIANILTKRDVHSQLQAVVFALRYDAVKVR
jgi:DNA-binding NarL/FixJ family response regulator